MALITSILALIVAIIFLANLFKPKESSGKGSAPGPRPWPIIGNLAYIGKFQDLMAAFKNLKEEYGSVASVQLGVHNAVVICGQQNFREVLLDKGHLFDARPNFKRFNLLFGGNKDNSMAFADGNSAHHKHRAAIAFHSFAKNGTNNFENLENITTQHIYNLVENIKNQIPSNQTFDVKPQISQAIASIFVKYFANIDVDVEDEVFLDMVSAFDIIFQEVNAGCVGDVLPFLMPFINKSEYAGLTGKVREFTNTRCFDPIKKQRIGGEFLDDNNNCQKIQPEKKANVINDLLDMVDNDPDVDQEQASFVFEDIVGGHAAASNSLIRIILYLAKNPDVQQKIRQEVREKASGFPTMSDRLTYTEAAVWEAFRFISSPIVPHVAVTDTTINDFSVKKDTLIFFNNMEMNFSPDLWESPEKFMPERFITEEGRILKPEYFLPFSVGKRNCLGYKMAINISKVIIANLCQSFEIELDPSTNYDMERGVIAVGRNKIFPFMFKPVVE